MFYLLNLGRINIETQERDVLNPMAITSLVGIAIFTLSGDSRATVMLFGPLFNTGWVQHQ